ncbi:MAG: undecaprenyl/decaprenyl-phosphate alpha-N-acetylglucosaminyl 1-phosphate transferase [Bacteroidales bacterium]|nr:undecaprenyl/decaprenyl-phosphate alpha-N-acetylglucosaminyl 1-phosphate transferase [Bacteroidales bacterium]
MNIYLVIVGFILSFVITFYFIPHIIKITSSKNIYDKPSFRKLHSHEIPTLGGLAILIGFLFSLSFLSNFCLCNHLQYFIVGCILIAIIGTKDDIIGLDPKKKFLGQLMAATIVVIFGKLQIPSFFHIFGIGELPYVVKILFSILVIVIYINAFNFIDGIDGLAAALALISSLTFGLIFLFYNDVQHALIAFCLSGALFAFMFFNVSPAKIFMGDTGSMLTGLTISILTIEFIIFNQDKSTLVWSVSTPTIAMAITFLPLFDLVRVVIFRLINKKSPFKPDKTHLHHLLIRLGLSHNSVTLILVALQLLLIFVSFLLNKHGNYAIGFTLLIICIIFTSVSFYFYKFKIKSSR